MLERYLMWWRSYYSTEDLAKPNCWKCKKNRVLFCHFDLCDSIYLNLNVLGKGLWFWYRHLERKNCNPTRRKCCKKYIPTLKSFFCYRKCIPSFVNRRVIYLWIKIFDWDLKFQIENKKMLVCALIMCTSAQAFVWLQESIRNWAMQVSKKSARGPALITLRDIW